MSEHWKAATVHGATDFSDAAGPSGLSQAWLIAHGLWSSSRIVGAAMLALMAATWLWLQAGYGTRTLRSPNAVIIAGVNLLGGYPLVRTAIGLIHRVIEAICGGYAEPVPVLVPIPLAFRLEVAPKTLRTNHPSNERPNLTLSQVTNRP